MRAIWSFWSAPYKAREWPWASAKYHLLSWVLSVERARVHSPDTMLVTDDEGARLLVDGIQVNFGRVATDLNALNPVDKSWWALGKLYAYRLQERPFVHIDADVVLWKRLPARLSHAALFGQSPEPLYEYPYVHDLFKRLRRLGGWVPEEIVETDACSALCCGIFGGTHCEFIRHYANLAIRIIENASNRAIWPALGTSMVLLEQYLPMVCLEYEKRRIESPFKPIQAEYLFQSVAEVCDEGRARELGYTHLACGAKQLGNIVHALEARVAQDHPAGYDACMRYLREKKLG